MSLLVDLLALTFAAGSIVDVWDNGSLFEERRANVEAYRVYGRAAPWWARLLDCEYCLSFHTAFWPACILFTTAAFLPQYVMVARAPIYALAAWRLSFILNGLLPDRLRYRRFLITEDDDDDGPATDTDDGGDPGGGVPSGESDSAEDDLQ